jgi:hypothetical protein
MSEQLSKLSEVSMVSANFGNGLAYREILLDWFKFLGGKPGEVIVVDGGSDSDTQKVYWELYQEGLIDKLQIIAPHHPDNDKERCFIQEYTVAAIASKPYVLWFKIDTLPYREGHDGWLEEAIDYLERDEIFAVGGAFNRSYPHLDAWAGWYFIQACTINFSLMKHSTFVAVMQEFAGEYIASRFEGTHQFGRFLLEKHLAHICRLTTNILCVRLKTRAGRYFTRMLKTNICRRFGRNIWLAKMLKLS